MSPNPNNSTNGSAKTNSHTRNALFLKDINFFAVKDQANTLRPVFQIKMASVERDHLIRNILSVCQFNQKISHPLNR